MPQTSHPSTVRHSTTTTQTYDTHKHTTTTITSIRTEANRLILNTADVLDDPLPWTPALQDSAVARSGSRFDATDPASYPTTMEDDFPEAATPMQHEDTAQALFYWQNIQTGPPLVRQPTDTSEADLNPAQTTPRHPNTPTARATSTSVKAKRGSQEGTSTKSKNKRN